LYNIEFVRFGLGMMREREWKIMKVYCYSRPGDTFYMLVSIFIKRSCVISFVVEDFDQSDVPRVDEQAVGDLHHAHVEKPIVNFGKVVDPIFDPGPPKTASGEKENAPVDTESNKKMLSAVIGLSPFPGKIKKEAACWNCTLQLAKQQEAGDKEPKLCAQFKKRDKMIVAIEFVHKKKNEETAKASADNSPLVLWTKTCLFLHCCLWLGGKLCTRCTEGVFDHLYQNFTHIIDSMVSKVKNAPMEESARSSSEDIFFMQWESSRATNTGHDSLGCGLAGKTGSAKFIFYFIRFLVNAKWDKDYPSNTDIMTIRSSTDNKVLVAAKKKEMAETQAINH